MTQESEARALIQADDFHRRHSCELTEDQIRPVAFQLYETAQENGFRDTDGQDTGSWWFWFAAERVLWAMQDQGGSAPSGPGHSIE